MVTSRRFARLLLVAAGPGLVLAVALVNTQIFAGRLFGDAYAYLAAGERLNAGHHLYVLQPGDRPVAISPPFWTVPLLSPPIVGVLWRPLAAMPDELGIVVWLASAYAALLGGILWLWRRNAVAASVGLALLSVPIAIELGLGNVNAFLLAGTIALWALRDRPASGVILGAMVAVKAWPVLLVVWLVGQGSWKTLGYAAATAVLLTLAGVVGSSIADATTYLEIVAGVHLSAFSPSWLLDLPWLWAVTAIVGSACTLLLRRRPGVSFAVAVVTMVLGSPVVNPNTYAVLLAALAPIRERPSDAIEQG